MSKKFIRRSLLYVPGSSTKMIAKAVNVTADSIILDLEDSVSITEKESARFNVINAVKSIQDTGKEAIIRVNAINSLYGIWDILEVSKVLPNAIIIPKADEKSIIVADMLLESSEENLGVTKNSIKLIPLIETTYGIVNVYSILQSAKRVNGVQLGAEDLTKEMGIDRTGDGEEIRHARNSLIYAGRACGVDILDTPFTGIKDMEGLALEVNLAKDMGYTGKVCIHPDHIQTINDIFSPKAEEVEFAKRLLVVYEAALSEGKGACMFEGKMIDKPIAERAQKVLEKAQLICGF